MFTWSRGAIGDIAISTVVGLHSTLGRLSSIVDGRDMGGLGEEQPALDKQSDQRN